MVGSAQEDSHFVLGPWCTQAVLRTHHQAGIKDKAEMQ